MRILKYFMIAAFSFLAILVLIPEKHFKTTTHQLAIEAEISPHLAKLILHTKVGRKVGYLFVKKLAVKEFKSSYKSLFKKTKD